MRFQLYSLFKPMILANLELETQTVDSLHVFWLRLGLTRLLDGYEMATIVTGQNASPLKVVEELEVPLELGGLALVVTLPILQQCNLSLHLGVLGTHLLLIGIISLLLLMRPSLLTLDGHHRRA